VPEGGIDPPSSHMQFPGTISITESTFEQVLESASRSFKSAGFKNVVFLGDHGGYKANDAHVADKLNREWRATDARGSRRHFSDVGGRTGVGPDGQTRERLQVQ
jgi:creatinine amidohydrolase/Fe(II)-dependent formamide hydrolase-like protein